jgi:hypothetical protein
MKRTQRPGSIRSSNNDRNRTIDANRLIDVRGGGGITIEIVGPTPFEMTLQHNETFVRL